MTSRSKVKAAVAIVAVVALCVACDPGWTNPVVGTGDGSGTTPGSVAVAADQVALGNPGSMVDLGARGFLVYDSTNCTIVRVADDQATRFAGNGTCGYSGDGGPATAAQITSATTPLGMSIGADAAGNVFIESKSGSNIRRIDATTGDISTVISFPTGGPLSLGGVVEVDGSLTLLERTQPDASGNSSDELHRIDSNGNDTLLASTPAEETPSGFVEVGEECYAAIENVLQGDGTSEPRLLVFDHGTVSRTALSVSQALSSTWELIPHVGTADGSVYGIASNTNEPWPPTNGNLVFRMNPDHSVEVIAGAGAGDPGTDRQMGRADQLNLTAAALALTDNGNLLISSGHTVYNLADPAHAPAVTPATG